MDIPHVGCNAPSCPCRQEDAPPTLSHRAETDEELFVRYKAECPALVKFEGFPYHHFIEIVAVYNSKVQITFWPTRATAPAQPQMKTTMICTSVITLPATQQPHDPAPVHPSKSTANAMRHYSHRTHNYNAALHRILKRQQEKDAPPPPTFNAPGFM